METYSASLPKAHSKDKHAKNRLNHRPTNAQDGLRVMCLGVAPDQKIKKISVCPEFAEVNELPAGARFENGDGSRCWTTSNSLIVSPLHWAFLNCHIVSASWPATVCRLEFQGVAPGHGSKNCSQKPDQRRATWQ